MGALSGKVAVITGGGTGIGKASALLLAQEGANVVVNYSRSEQAANETVGELQKHGVKATAVKADVSQREQAEALVDASKQAFGRIDLLVNSAGRTRFIPYAQLDDLTDDVWNE